MGQAATLGAAFQFPHLAGVFDVQFPLALVVVVNALGTRHWSPKPGSSANRFSGDIRPGTPLTLEDARRVAGELVKRYKRVRLHSALG